jgi:hypothetical protein
MTLPKKCCSTLFTTAYKRLTQDFCFGVSLLAFALWDYGAFGFWMKGGFLIWEALEGERIAEGKRIAEGELLKGNC